MNIEPGIVETYSEKVDPVCTDTSCKPSHTSALLLSDSVDRILGMTGCPHFNSDPDLAVRRKKIDLPIVETKVGVHDHQTMLSKEPGGKLFP